MIQRHRLILVLLLLGGFALRLYRLGADSLWYDETVSAMLASKAIPDLIAHTARDIHPPGYYLVLHLWTQIAGNTEFSLAYLSLLASMLLLVSTYILARRLAGRRIATVTLGLMAIAPYQLWYAQEVRMYTLGAWLGVMLVILVLPLRTQPLSRRNWLAYALAGSAGLYVLYYFGFLLLVINSWLLIQLWRHQRAQLRAWLLANVILVTLYLPWLPIAWRQASNPPVPPWREALPLDRILSETWLVLTLGEAMSLNIAWPVLILTALLYGLGLVALSPRYRFLLPWLTFGPLLVILLLPILIGASLYHVRYMFTYAPAFYIVLAAGLAYLWRHQRWLTISAGGILLLGCGLAFHNVHHNPRYANDDFRTAIETLQARWQPGDAILVNAGYVYASLDYYLSQSPVSYVRLSHFEPQQFDPRSPHPVIFTTGTINGDPNLGWGNPASDFYALPLSEAEAALEAINHHYHRLWQLRVYDTVTDPDTHLRRWLNRHMTRFEDQVFSGSSNIRLQGYLTANTASPPRESTINFDDKLVLQGYQPPRSQAGAGERIFVTLWWAAQPGLADLPPLAISLKLWDSQGQLAAQHDEWPLGNELYTPGWPMEDILRHPLSLTLPATLPPGQYWLDVEVYHTETLAPLPRSDGEGHVVTLGGVTIVP